MLNLDQKYLEFIENLQEGIWMIDPNSRTTFVNKFLANMLGYSKQEMIGKHLFEFMDTDAQKSAKKYLERRAQGLAESHLFEFTSRIGDKVYTSINTYPLVDNEGSFYGSVASISDISEKIALEKKSSELEFRFKSIFDNASVGVAILNNEKNVIQANPYFYKQLGFSHDDILPIDIRTLFSSSDAEEINTRLNDLFDGRESHLALEKEYILKDSSKKWGLLSFVIIKSANDTSSNIIFVIRDLTEEKLAKDAIQKQEALFKGVLDNSSAAITIWDRELRNIYHNQAAFHQVGRVAEQVPPRRHLREGLKNYPAFYDKWEKRLKLCFEKGNTYSFSDEDILNGKTVFSENNLNPIKDLNGNVFAAAIIFRDVTGRKRLEKQLHEKSNFTALGEMAAKISHQIKSPLASIAMNMELLEQEKNLTDKQNHVITITKDAIKRLNNLLSDILNTTHEFQLHKSSFDIFSLINQIILLLHSSTEGKGIVLKNNVQSKFLNGDSEKIFAALLNMVENSLDAIGQNGEIDIYSQNNFDRGLFELFIKDSGNGIQDKDKLFDLFYTTKPKGTGFGLPIAKNIMENHGGNVVLVSSKAGETIFKLTLPLDDKDKK